ncbi:diaminopimelate epimerase [Butyrivibrio sp. YAB3001]|uniref:diaminopimelate epimerase n=1 Tax=Butyrivibrio sp. YAB3001 TaxID=1520812 RepID=UPI000B80EA42
MTFTKMHGCGNDYVYIDGAKEIIPSEKKPELARLVSDRHFGIGSDGLIFINPVEDNSIDFEMEMYNADGSRSEMCGNGIRCVAKYVYDNNLTDKKSLVIVSAGQKKYIDLTVGDDNKVSSVKVNMGAPILTPSLVPVNPALLSDSSEGNIKEDYSLLTNSENTDPSNAELIKNQPIFVKEIKWNVTCVSMGNPHAVVVLPEDFDLENFGIDYYGPFFENHAAFPNRTNTEFVKIDDRNNVHMRVWERGTGETLACGTGCCATAVACILNGLSDNTITVHVLGGDIVCSWDGQSESPVIMEGPATTVFTGEIELL